MQKAPPAALLFLLPLLAACGDKDDSGPDTAPDSPVDTAPDSSVDTGPDTQPPDDPAIEACSDGTAGFITSPELAVHVWADAEPDGDGSWAHPFQDIDSALEATRLVSDDKRIAIWGGSYSANLRLSADAGDSGTIIQGCGMDEVFIDADAADAPVIMISEAQDVQLEGLCTRGGTRNIQVWSDALVSLTAVRSTQASSAGVLIHGALSVASLDGVEVDGLIPDADGLGYGIAVQQGASATISGGSISGATAVGVFIDDATEIDISGLAVADTATDASGFYGHGLQVQADTVQVTVDTSSFTDNQGAGVFVLQGLGFTMSASTVFSTVAAAIPDSAETTGDGVVISRGEGNINPATFVASLEGNTIEGSARAGILLDGVTAALSSNVLSGNGYGEDIAVAQDSAAFSGTDDVTELAEVDTLELNLVPLAAIDPGTS